MTLYEREPVARLLFQFISVGKVGVTFLKEAFLQSFSSVPLSVPISRILPHSYTRYYIMDPSVTSNRFFSPFYSSRVFAIVANVT